MDVVVSEEGMHISLPVEWITSNLTREYSEGWFVTDSASIIQIKAIHESHITDLRNKQRPLDTCREVVSRKEKKRNETKRMAAGLVILISYETKDTSAYARQASLLVCMVKFPQRCNLKNRTFQSIEELA